MAHRFALEAEADLDDIWYYIATENSSVEIAESLAEQDQEP
jgi:plasmid stabilization system protein ParE